ncbi:synaptotagmin-like protein 2 isoform X2 [Hyaena hyaena]|uniref:synaptotagmin-like protein 2 isoform X2 n=1 Tax=Hyaena hyaena TaxID=95912 RepID=UPI0019231ABF|nr:synaptotagmin-like protein 2 isoform X2 [Hyaena hyaena]
MESVLTFQGKGNMLPSGNCQNNNVNIKHKSINFPQKGKEGLGILQSCEVYDPNQGSKTMDYRQGSKHIGEGNQVLPPTNNYSYSALTGLDAEDQVPCNIEDVGTLGEEEPKLHVYEKNRGNSEVNFDSSTLVKEPNLKYNMKTEKKSKEEDTYILKASLEPEYIESLRGITKDKSWKKPEVQLQEAGEVPKNQVQREKYKRVSDRISFWEGEKAAAKLTHKEPTSSCSQRQPSAKAYQLVKSMDNLSTGQTEYSQVTSKQVVIDANGPIAHLSSFYSSNKPKETRPQIPGPSKNCPSVDQTGEVSPFNQNKINEPIKRLPEAESSHHKRDITLPSRQHPSGVESGIHTPLERDRSLTGELNPNFTVMSLKERMDEPSTEQVYNHSQFENLRKFWDLGANTNSQDNVEKNTTIVSQKHLVPFNSQKHKEVSDIKSSGKNIHEIGTLPGKKKIPAREETEELNSKYALQVLPDETTFPLRPSKKSAHQLPGNESSKENVKKNMEWFVTPVFKEEKDYSDQEIQESIVKTSVLSKDCNDAFNDNLQKLLLEASSPAMQTSGGKVHEKQVPERDISGNKTWPHNTDFADTEEEVRGHKEIINEHVDKTVAPPKVKPNTLTASLDKLLKEATGTSPSPLPTVLKPVTTKMNAEREKSRVYEKGIEWSDNTSAYQKEIIAPFPKGEETLGNAALPQKAESGSEEEPSSVLKTLEKSATRKMTSKSLEDISSDSPNQAKVDNLPEELVRSAEDVSTVPSQPDNQFSHPDKLKRMSKSVPAFLQDESDDRETDTASESSYQLSRHKKSPSSLTNLSSSSGMTSLSSVSGSVMSVYSGDFGNLEVKGNIQFAIDYVDSLKELHVFVAQCKDLAAADVKKQRSDPYVKTYLLPDKGKMGKKKTLVVKKTLNPVYNEILRYKVEKQILKTQKLNLSVWHRDTFKRNSFLGEVELDLETWDWDNKQNKQLKWYPLKRKTAPVALEAENRGEMKLALQYVPEPFPGKKLPTTGEVHIWVKECLDLPLLRGSHLNSFVKCIILPDTSRKSRQKTRAVGKTTNPVFNHTMVYDGFRPEDLTEACVELTVWDHYKLTNQFLGGLRIGFGTGKSYGTEVDWMDSTSEEVALWEKMVNSPNTWIEATLPLRMLLIAKISK